MSDLSVIPSTAPSRFFTGRFINDYGTYYIQDVIKITAAKIPVARPVRDLMHNLTDTTWDCSGLLPANVMRWSDNLANTTGTKAVDEHIGLCLSADLQYPIIISDNDEIVDGLHRLCKAIHLKHDTIMTVYISQAELNDIDYD